MDSLVTNNNVTAIDNDTEYRFLNGNNKLQNARIHEKTKYKVYVDKDGLDIEYTDGTVFTANGISARYYPYKSNFTCSSGSKVIQTYNIKLKPSCGYIDGVAVNNYDLINDTYKITMGSSFVENPTWINITVNESNKIYDIYMDSEYCGKGESNSKSILKWKYNGTWNTNHTFMFQPSTEQPDTDGLCTISGYIRETNCSSISNVSVSNNITPEVVLTDTNGYYEFTVPSNSKLTINASKEGYNSSSICLNVCKINISNANIILTQKENKDQVITPEAIIEITSRIQIIEPKKSFDLSIKVDPSTPISGTQLDFVFNSSKTSVNNVTEGDLLKQGGAYTIFSKGTINNSAGTVKNIYGFILGTSNVSSPGTMATVNLTAGSKTGFAEFSLSNVLISDADSKSVPYTVTNATVLIDTAPVMSTICCPKSVDEKSTLTFKVSAKDADGDRLVLSASGLPQGASFNKTSGNFTWTPAVGQAGVYTLTFEVSDGYLTDSENVTVTVNKLNNPPVISSFQPINGSSFSEGERIGISVNASDAEGQALNYSIRIDGVVCSTGTEYIWETDYSSSGNHTIEVVVSDGIDEVKVQHTIYISECRPRWDVNEDGVVNILDVTNVSKNYGATVSKPYPRYDVNQDGAVNILDLTLVGNHFGELVK
ncbi:putative Ig domain-containing protein [Methanosarcina sp.]|uniref:putative Ig domain-containing protein n=1 Tax=Methanosarcina sp. TaxID=2213 RepID=UPI002B6D17BB|nr:putative Ig domain-containing protein [Methanosarcina sp.]HOW14305.1 putative Ig domain-containing protein [Methanosarcina sp.]